MAARFSSASEVTEHLKRKANVQYYTNNPQNQKYAFSSTYTTFLGGSVSAQGVRKVCGCQPGSTVDNATCCVNSRGFQQRPEKVAPGKNVFNPC